jgi:hypothetical protein
MPALGPHGGHGLLRRVAVGGVLPGADAVWSMGRAICSTHRCSRPGASCAATACGCIRSTPLAMPAPPPSATSSIVSMRAKSSRSTPLRRRCVPPCCPTPSRRRDGEWWFA